MTSSCPLMFQARRPRGRASSSEPPNPHQNALVGTCLTEEPAAASAPPGPRATLLGTPDGNDSRLGHSLPPTRTTAGPPPPRLPAARAAPPRPGRPLSCKAPLFVPANLTTPAVRSASLPVRAEVGRGLWRGPGRPFVRPPANDPLTLQWQDSAGPGHLELSSPQAHPRREQTPV